MIRRSVESEPSDDRREVLQIDPGRIGVNREQPRQHFDEERLGELTRSIQRHGILQPLLVHLRGDGRYELVAGERRLRAAIAIGLDTVPVVLREIEDDHLLLDLALVENIQREDLNPIELAEAYRTLKERHQWTQAQLAESVGKKRSSVANTLRYLELPKEVQASLAAGEISEGHVKVLLSADGAGAQADLFRQLREWNLTVRELEDRVASLREKPGASKPRTGAQRRPPRRIPRDPQLLAEEEELSGRLGTRVEIRTGQGGKGRIFLEYYGPEDYARIKAILLSGSQP